MLVLADPRVPKDPAFLNVSVTPEQWVRLLEVLERAHFMDAHRDSLPGHTAGKG